MELSLRIEIGITKQEPMNCVHYDDPSHNCMIDGRRCGMIEWLPKVCCDFSPKDEK